MTQLFKKEPTEDLFIKVLNTIGLNEFKEEFSFRKKDLVKLDTVSKMTKLKLELEEYYYPCKAKLYTENINENRCITILRQFLRQFGYNLLSKEKYCGGEKFIVYSLKANHHIKSPKEVVIHIKA